MSTRKIILKNEYLRLCQKIDFILDKKNILPSINDYEISDVIFMFNIYVSDSNEFNYKDKIDNLLNIGSIELTNEELNLIYEPIFNFVIWYKNLH